MTPPLPDTSVPFWIKLVVGIEAAFSALFFFWSWSHAVGLAQGRPASIQDLAGLALPLALVVVLGAAAIMLCRIGRRDWAGLSAIAPWPLAMVAYSALGAI